MLYMNWQLVAFIAVTWSTLAVLTVALFRWVTTIRVTWSPIEKFMHASYFVEGYAPLDEVFLATALTKVFELLQKHTRWDRDQLRFVMQYLHVYVKKDNLWVDQWGRRVCKPSRGHVIAVGYDLRALLHETVHVADRVLDRVEDPKHESWARRGIVLADIDYGTWLGHSRWSYITRPTP